MFVFPCLCLCLIEWRHGLTLYSYSPRSLLFNLCSYLAYPKVSFLDASFFFGFFILLDIHAFWFLLLFSWLCLQSWWNLRPKSRVPIHRHFFFLNLWWSQGAAVSSVHQHKPLCVTTSCPNQVSLEPSLHFCLLKIVAPFFGKDANIFQSHHFNWIQYNNIISVTPTS